MNDRDHVQLQRDEYRPKGSRIDEDRPDAALYEAGAAGRSDVLGADGMLRLQRAVGNSAVQRAMGEESPVLDVVHSGGGEPLDTPVREDMEGRLGADFGDVRVHHDDKAHESTKAVNAHAYTVGSNVVFQRDKYDPSSSEGRTMLAHELTHVIQQRTGPVDGTPTEGGIRVSDPSDRFEREAARNADRVMSASPGTLLQRQAEGDGHDQATLQRAEGEEEEETAQGSFETAPVQRAEGEEEEETG
jgi:hypothetical protein